jgi:hypothetical protein
LGTACGGAGGVVLDDEYDRLAADGGGGFELALADDAFEVDDDPTEAGGVGRMVTVTA